MKIFFAIKTLNGIAGGAERVLCIIASKLSQLGHEVSIISFDENLSSPFYFLDPGVKRYILGTNNPNHKTTISEACSRTLELRKFILSNRPDIIVGFMHSIFVPLSFSLIGTGIPVIASEHIVPQYYADKKLEFAAVIASSVFAKRITVLSNAVKKLYPLFLQRKMIVLPNPVDEFPAYDPSKKEKIILSIGRLDPQKDQKTLIKAFHILSADFPEWSLHIAGAGPLLTDLQDQIRQLGLEKRVLLVGRNEKIHEEYSRASIFVLSSIYESFGLVTAEALSLGLPAIGFADCPGTNEIIQHGKNGLLASGPDRAISLAAEMKKLMEGNNLREALGRNGPASVQQYNPETVARAWESALRQTL